ncbi:MAG: gliding motility-associated peptidyl-prolyl isomerase [Flavobacterium sp.]|jgi:gliding motility-associated peptidyl-prolyl isomerase
MNKLPKLYIFLLVLIFCFIGCKQQQARMPISQSSGVFLKKSAERNKVLVKKEEKQIDSIIKSNPNIKYVGSNKGYWYYYNVKKENDSIFPKKGDIVTFEYDMKDLKNNTIYSKQELGVQTYAVDKQNILLGLRDGIKLMKKGETVTFLFPSHSAFGYHGDDDRIGINEPLICEVTLLDIKNETTNVSKQPTENPIENLENRP